MRKAKHVTRGLCSGNFVTLHSKRYNAKLKWSLHYLHYPYVHFSLGFLGFYPPACWFIFHPDGYKCLWNVREAGTKSLCQKDTVVIMSSKHSLVQISSSQQPFHCLLLFWMSDPDSDIWLWPFYNLNASDSWSLLLRGHLCVARCTGLKQIPFNSNLKSSSQVSNDLVG